MVSVVGLFISVGTSLVLFLILELIFVWLSRSDKNSVIFFPARILSGKDPPLDASRRGVVTWIREAWKVSEQELVAFAGLDSAVYIRFLKTSLQISMFAAFFGIIILVPICISDHRYEEYNRKQTDPAQRLSYDSFDLLGMGNISKESSKLWAFAVAAYWVTLGTFYFLYRSSQRIADLCADFQGAYPRSRVEQYTALVRDIPHPPADMSVQSHVDEFFRTLYPDTFLKSHVVYCLGKVMPTWRKLEATRIRLAHAEATLAAWGGIESRRPQHRPGFLGLTGKKVDSIKFYEQKVKDLLLTLEDRQRQMSDKDATDAAFIFFKTREAAHIAAQVVHSRRSDQWQVSLAPDPPAVQWENLAIPLYQRLTLRLFVWVISAAVIIVFLAVIAVVTALASLSNLESTFEFLRPILEYGPLKSILEAYLPQLILIGTLYLMPYFFHFLVKFEGIQSASRKELAASGQHFNFLVVNVFLGVTITGTILGTLKEIIHEPARVISLLGSSLPPNASFFITYVALKFFVGYGIELSRVYQYLSYKISRRFLGVQEHEVYAWLPGQLLYFSIVSQDLLIMTLGLCYAVIAPMILIFTALYFLVAYFVYRHQVMNVYVPANESGGRMWPHMHVRILAALLIAQLTLLGFFSLQLFAYTNVLIPLPLMTLIYGWMTSQRFGAAFRFPPLEVVQHKPKEEPTLEDLELAYTPPCLRSENAYHQLGGEASAHHFPAFADSAYGSLVDEQQQYLSLGAGNYGTYPVAQRDEYRPPSHSSPSVEDGVH